MKKIIIDNKKLLDKSLLTNFGFILNDDKYTYERNILNGDFKVVISINNSDNQIISKIIDNYLNEEYSMVDIETLTGEFVGKVKDEYKSVIEQFINKCTVPNLNYNNQVKNIIKYINKKYNDEIEYLWKTTPNSGIFRNKTNRKWYAAILEVKESVIDGDNKNEIMVIDLMYHKGKTSDVIDYNKIYPGYHMNKNSWITIKLNNTVNDELIYKYIDLSYNLSIKK